MRSINSVVAIAVGATLLIAMADPPPSARTAPVEGSVSGTVIVPDDGSPSGLYAYLTSATHRDSVAIGEAATFQVPIGAAHCGPIDLRIDHPSGEDRRYHAAIVHLDAAGRPVGSRSRSRRSDAGPAVRVLLVPTRHVIDGGTYAGTVVPIAVDAALSPLWQRTRYWRIARVASGGYGTPVAWPESFFPIPVSLRAPGGVESSDSAAFWRTARQLERDFGRSLFEAVADAPAEEEIWKIVVAVEPAVTSAGITFITYDAHGAIYEALVAMRARASLADERLVSHELMHALGFGHSSGWYSAAGPSPQTPSRATPTDVAYAQLLYRLRRAHVAEGATHGILASSLEGRRPVTARAIRCAP